MKNLEDSLEDGMRLTTGSWSDGSVRIYEVFTPRWWRIDRWIVWLLNRKRRSTFTTIHGEVRVLLIAYSTPVRIMPARNMD